MSEKRKRFSVGTPAADRLAARSERTSSGCLEWTGAINSAGYGSISIDGRSYVTHRLAWEWLSSTLRLRA